MRLSAESITIGCTVTDVSEHKELYQWYKEHRICPQCGSNKAAPHRVRCWECLHKNAESTRKQREKKNNAERQQNRNRHNVYLSNLRKERKQKGLCIWCGKPRTPTSTCFCLDCKIKNQRKNDARKIGIERSERPAYGLCYICGSAIEEGEKLCEKCLQRSINNLPDKMNTELYQKHKNENRAIFNNG